jgi:hypothetical protein
VQGLSSPLPLAAISRARAGIRSPGFLVLSHHGCSGRYFFFFPGSVGRLFSFHVRIGQNTEVVYPAASAILAACEDDRPVPQVKTRSVSFE